MFFQFSKLLPMFFFPLSLFVLLSLVAFFQLKKSAFRWLYLLALLMMLLLSNHFFSGFLIGSLESRYPARGVADIETPDVIVLLGGMINPLGANRQRVEFFESADRLLAAEELMRTHRRARLLISGGSGLLLQRGEPEALILKKWLVARGFRPERILVETRSRNTAENAINSARLIKDRGWRKVVLVTSAFHMHRSVLCFKRNGVRVIPFPVDYRTFREVPGPEAFAPAVESLTTGTIALKEIIGLVAYWFKGYI